MASPHAAGVAALIASQHPNWSTGAITGKLTGTADPMACPDTAQYAFFPAVAGTYIATYGTDAAAPTVSATSPANAATGVAIGVQPTVTFSEAMTAASIGTSTIELRDASNTLVSATVLFFW